MKNSLIKMYTTMLTLNNYKERVYFKRLSVFLILINAELPINFRIEFRIKMHEKNSFFFLWLNRKKFLSKFSTEITRKVKNVLHEQ